MNSRLTKVLALVNPKADDSTTCMEAVLLDRLKLKDNGCRMPGPCAACGYQGTNWIKGLKLCLD